MKIRKRISILLATLLLVSNIGLAFNVHYCGEKIASVSLNNPFINQNSEDGCCTIVEKKANCCNDKVVKFDKKSDNSIVKTISFQIDTPVISQDWKPLIFAKKSILSKEKSTSYSCNTNSLPIFMRHCQLVFYA